MFGHTRTTLIFVLSIRSDYSFLNISKTIIFAFYFVYFNFTKTLDPYAQFVTNRNPNIYIKTQRIPNITLFKKNPINGILYKQKFTVNIL